MKKSEGGKHYSVVTRTEPTGDLRSNTCFAKVAMAEKYATSEAFLRERQGAGHVIYESTRVFYLSNDTRDDAVMSVKVVVCYSVGCSLFRRMPKSHLGLVS